MLPAVKSLIADSFPRSVFCSCGHHYDRSVHNAPRNEKILWLSATTVHVSVLKTRCEFSLIKISVLCNIKEVFFAVSLPSLYCHRQRMANLFTEC